MKRFLDVMMLLAGLMLSFGAAGSGDFYAEKVESIGISLVGADPFWSIEIPLYIFGVILFGWAVYRLTTVDYDAGHIRYLRPR